MNCYTATFQRGHRFANWRDLLNYRSKKVYGNYIIIHVNKLDLDYLVRIAAEPSYWFYLQSAPDYFRINWREFMGLDIEGPEKQPSVFSYLPPPNETLLFCREMLLNCKDCSRTFERFEIYQAKLEVKYLEPASSEPINRAVKIS
jgi:hypothetical protein